MNDVLSYLLIYYLFIDSQKGTVISKEKMAPFWVKSRFCFYCRLLFVDLKNAWIMPVIGIGLIVVGILLQVASPILLVCLLTMYSFNCLLQYDKVYQYMKYVLYLIPVVFLLLARADLIYVGLVCILLTNLYFLYTFKFNLYQTYGPQLSSFNVRNKAIALSLVGLGILCMTLFIITYYHISVPIEELGAIFALFLVIAMSVEVSTNKMLAMTIRSRFDNVRLKSHIISLDFLVSKQKVEIFAVLAGIFLSGFVLGTIRQDYLTSFVLCLGVVMYFLAIIDYIVQCILLGQSIVYENKVMREGIQHFFSFTIFIYLASFVVNKYMGNTEIVSEDTVNEFLNIFWHAKIVYFLFYMILILFFVYRLHKTFTINDQSGTILPRAINRAPEASKKC